MGPSLLWPTGSRGLLARGLVASAALLVVLAGVVLAATSDEQGDDQGPEATADDAAEHATEIEPASGEEPSTSVLAQAFDAGPFVDVPATSVFSEEITWLAASGITRGCDTEGARFCPGDAVTRGQMAAFIARAADLPEGSGRSFEDVAAGSTFAADIDRLASAGVTQGCDPQGARFCPDDDVTRGQMAAFLHRAFADEPCADGQAHTIFQHGIQWTFDREYPCGTYANGDYWIVGPVTITRIAPPSVAEGDRVINGAMINPSPRDDNDVGYGHIRSHNYAPEKNVAAGVTSSDPLVVDTHSSLVSTISVEEADARPGIHTAAVLTVVDDAPAAGSFRPPYSGSDKSSRFTTGDLRTDLLPELTPVEGTPDIHAMAGEFERVWLDHVPKWRGRSSHPVTSMPDYGRDLASLLGQGSLTLMLDFSDEEKHDLLVNFVQVGIDLFGVVEDGGERNWTADGGHAQGRKWPILFAGTMLDDPAMSGIGERDEVVFGEDAQTFYVTQEDVDRGVGYSSDDLGLAEWGLRHDTDPSQDDPAWDASYRQCCTANSWGGHVLSARIMGLQDAWNHDALFDYTDRYLGKMSPGSHERFWDRPFTENMWDTYRPQF